MNEQHNTDNDKVATPKAVLDVTTSAPTYKMSLDETVKMLQGYSAQADTTLKQLDANIDSANAQVADWQRMKLMIIGQKQLIQDIINKTVNSQPADVNNQKTN